MSAVQTQPEHLRALEARDEAFSSLFMPERPVAQRVETESKIDRRSLLVGFTASFFGGMPLGVQLLRHQLQLDKYQLWIKEDYHFYFSQGATGSAFDDSLLSCRQAPNSDALIVTQERCGDEARFEHWLGPDGEYMRSRQLGSESFRKDGYFLTRGKMGDFSMINELDLEVLAGVLEDRRTRVYRGRPGKLVDDRKVAEFFKREFATPKKIKRADYRPEDMI